jgi:hypothetical protein
VRSIGGFSSHLRQPARDAQKYIVSTERCIPNGMRISKSGRRENKDTKTLFPPYFKNKTTLVATNNTHIFNLITLLFICFLQPVRDTQRNVIFTDILSLTGQASLQRMIFKDLII